MSVIIPLYNEEQLIGRCLESVLKLRIPKEIIVVDDGSTDDSAVMVERYMNSGEVRLLRQENKGVAEARNLGLSESRGDIIAFADSDDYIVPESFERLYGKFLESGADMARVGTIMIHLDGRRETREANSTLVGETLTGRHCFAEMMRTNTFTPLVFCHLMKKTLIDSHGLRFRYRYSEDDLWTSIAMCLAENVYVSDELHYVYCKKERSLTGQNLCSKLRADSHLAVAKDLYGFLSSNHMAEDAQNWMCCKILYLTADAIKTYIAIGDTDFEVSASMYQDLMRRVLPSGDLHAKRVAYMFCKRIIDMVKGML